MLAEDHGRLHGAEPALRGHRFGFVLAQAQRAERNAVAARKFGDAANVAALFGADQRERRLVALQQAAPPCGEDRNDDVAQLRDARHQLQHGNPLDAQQPGRLGGTTAEHRAATGQKIDFAEELGRANCGRAVPCSGARVDRFELAFEDVEERLARVAELHHRLARCIVAHFTDLVHRGHMGCAERRADHRFEVGGKRFHERFPSGSVISGHSTQPSSRQMPMVREYRIFCRQDCFCDQAHRHFRMRRGGQRMGFKPPSRSLPARKACIIST